MLTYQEYYWMRPDEFKGGDMVSVKLVCVVGHGNDYAIYYGPTDLTDEQIAHGGDKLTMRNSDDVGNAVFASIAQGRHYRR